MHSLFLFAAANEAGAAVAEVFVEAEKTKFEIVSEGIVGFFIVVFILAILSSVIQGLSLFFREKTSAPAPAATVPAPAAGIPEAHAKVVAAAALHTALRGEADNPHLPVILAAAAQVAAEPSSLQLPEAGTGWSMEGRRGIFSSHVLKKR
ncbi:MAG: hypothetical protein LBG65_05380 [Puniceicoccales bacterium]|jgi:hypothetical protein|nr:hypothetical protein [Puniceicoccales bacterium]